MTETAGWRRYPCRDPEQRGTTSASAPGAHRLRLARHPGRGSAIAIQKCNRGGDPSLAPSWRRHSAEQVSHEQRLLQVPDDAEARLWQKRGIFEKGRDDKHGDASERAGAVERLEECRPGHHGHAEVEHDAVGDDRPHERQGIAAVARRQNLVPSVSEYIGPEFADGRVIIDDENARESGGHHAFKIAPQRWRSAEILWWQSG